MFPTKKDLNDTFKINISKVYFIGIGGAGISALAIIFLELGYEVSGSDIAIEDSDYLDTLKVKIKIYKNHFEENIKEFKPDLIIYTEAIAKKHNQEYLYAKKNGILLINRSVMLNFLLSKKRKIAILGTHGKTTVSTLFSNIAHNAKLDPCIIIGGEAPFIHSNVYTGNGTLGIFEACEAYGALQNYEVDIALILNIDLDHIDYFLNLENLKKEFYHFIYRNFHKKSKKIILLNYDDHNIIDIIKNNNLELINLNYITISENLNIDEIKNENGITYIFHTKNVIFESEYTKFDFYINNIFIKSIISNLTGRVFLYNNLGVLGLAFLTDLPIDIDSILCILKNFKNPKRRFEKLFSYSFKEKNLLLDIYHDYAHHPKEIDAFFEKIYQLNRYDKNILIFQPHLTSRFLYFLDHFFESFTQASEVILLSSFQARKNNIQNQQNEIDFQKIIAEFKIKYPDKKIEYFDSFTFESFLSLIYSNLERNISISFIGAGNINILAKNFVTKLKSYLDSNPL